MKSKKKTPAKKAEGKAKSRSTGKGKGAPKAKPESRAQALTKLFLQTPEMKECQMVAGGIANKLDPGDTVSIKIDVPKEFVRLTEFLEEKRTAGGNVARPADKVLAQTLLNELHEQLHWLVTGPARYGYYRDLWNRFCDEHGAPEEKIEDPMTAPEKREEGPF